MSESAFGRDRASPSVRLGYATNAFPGETIAELIDSFRGPLCRIAREISQPGPLGVELRLSGKAVDELSAHPQVRARLVGELSEAGLEAAVVEELRWASATLLGGEAASTQERQVPADPGRR